MLIAAVASSWLWLAPGGAPGCDDLAACTSSAPQPRLDTLSLSDYLFTTTGAVGVSQDELRLSEDNGTPTGVIPFADPGDRFRVDVQLQGTLDGSTAIYLAKPETHSVWTPRPQRVGGWLVAFDVAGGQHLATYDLGSAPVGVAIVQSGAEAVVVDQDFLVQAFSLDQIMAEGSR